MYLKNSEMRNILKKYGVWEYVLFALGLVVLIKIVHSFVIDTLENTALNGVALIVGILFIAAPRTIVAIAKKKTGQNGKSNE